MLVSHELAGPAGDNMSLLVLPQHEQKPQAGKHDIGVPPAGN